MKVGIYRGTGGRSGKTSYWIIGAFNVHLEAALRNNHFRHRSHDLPPNMEYVLPVELLL